jgi:hypothetical protein
MANADSPRIDRRRPLRWEITVVLVVKALLLGLIWQMFFSDGHRQPVDSRRADQHLLGAPASAAGNSSGHTDGH